MLYFLDTEFIEGERTVDLVSIAVVADDQREYYAISTDFDPERANTFVQRSVLPLLEPRGHPAWKSRHRILDELVAFVGADQQPVFWTWGGSAYDVMQLAEEAGLATDPIDPRLPIPPADAHHALADARWTRAVYHFLRPAKGPIGS
jgi:hypothetical protein